VRVEEEEEGRKNGKNRREGKDEKKLHIPISLYA